MEKLRLVIPPRTADSTVSIGDSLLAIKAWVSGLPMADSPYVLKALLAGLKEINRYAFPLEVRLQIMPLLQPVVDELLVNLRSKGRLCQLPLQGRELQNAEAIWQLHTEVAYGYKILFFELLYEGSTKQKKKLPSITFHAICALADQLLDHYFYYYAEPKRCWVEIYTLYRYARHNNWHQGLMQSDGVRRSIESAFMQAILLAAVIPYRLMRGEVVQVNALMGALGHLCSLHAPTEGWRPTNELFIDLLQDRPPGCQPGGEAEIHLESVRVLDVSGLLDATKRRYKNLNLDADVLKSLEQRQQRDLFSRLMSGWGGAQERASERHPAEKVAVIQLGWKACCAVLANKKAEAAPIAETPAWSLSLAPKDDDGWRKSSSPSNVPQDTSAHFSIDKGSDVWASSAAIVVPANLEYEKEEALFDPYIVQQINESAGGVALDIRGEENSVMPGGMSLVVGELVALRYLKGKNLGWRIGAIRWQRLLQDGGGHVGVRLLASRARVVVVRAVAGVGLGSDFCQALLLERPLVQSQQPQIVVPSAIYEKGSELIVDDQGEKYRVSLSQMLESTGAYTLFAMKKE